MNTLAKVVLGAAAVVAVATMSHFVFGFAFGALAVVLAVVGFLFAFALAVGLLLVFLSPVIAAAVLALWLLRRDRRGRPVDVAPAGVELPWGGGR